jgi:hypothetical protein
VELGRCKTGHRDEMLGMFSIEKTLNQAFLLALKSFFLAVKISTPM